MRKILQYLFVISIFLVGILSCSNDNEQQQDSTSPAITLSPHRFFDNGDGTIMDLDTGLLWLKDANCFGSGTLSKTVNDVTILANGACSLTDGSRAGDWRLPDIKELFDLLDYSKYEPALPDEHLFVNIRTWYWSSTPSTSFANQFMVVNLNDGDTGDVSVNFASGFVLPVQGQQTVRTARFVDNGDGTVTEMGTGIIWLKDAGCFEPKTQTTALTVVSHLAHGMCDLTDESRAGDWRLPTIKELLSILDYSQHNPALPVGHPFKNIQTYYWSSTPFASHPGLAWNVYICDGKFGTSGDVGADSVNVSGYILPVRDKR